MGAEAPPRATRREVFLAAHAPPTDCPIPPRRTFFQGTFGWFGDLLGHGDDRIRRERPERRRRPERDMDSEEEEDDGHLRIRILDYLDRGRERGRAR